LPKLLITKDDANILREGNLLEDSEDLHDIYDLIKKEERLEKMMFQAQKDVKIFNIG